MSSLRSYDQLIGALESIVNSSQGAATLAYGHWTSNAGRGIPYIKIGNGPKVVMIVSQQHGDEWEVSDAAVDVIKTLTNRSAESRVIRESLTVVIAPRVNVDGFDGVDPNTG